MAKITWEKGDWFSFYNGFGIIVSEDSQAILIIIEGDKRTISKGVVPEQAFPFDCIKFKKQLPPDVDLAIRAVSLMI